MTEASPNPPSLPSRASALVASALSTIRRAGTAFPFTVRFYPGERRAMEPRARSADGSALRPSVWTRMYRMVVRGRQVKKAVPWSDDMAPYAPWIMDLWALPWVREMYLCWAPRTAKTNIGLSCLLYSQDQDPDRAMYVMPIEPLAKRIMKYRILPTIQAIARLARFLLGAYDTTGTHVSLSNGAETMVAWATSEAMLSSEDIRYMFLDEVDTKEWSPGSGPNPILLSRDRLGNHPDTYKLLVISKPGDAPSNIWNGLKEECDVVYCLEVRCPVCGHHQVMTDANIVWPSRITDHRTVRRDKLARYHCEKCGVFEGNHWDDHTRNLAVRAGRWIPGHISRATDDWEPVPEIDVPRHPRNCGAILPGWNAPDVSLSDVAACMIQAKDSLDHRRQLDNRYRARPHKQTAPTQNEAQILTHKTALASGIIPAGTIALTAGVDVQKIGFWFVVRAWMEDLTSHKIQHGFVTTWPDIEKILFETQYPVQNSPLTMGIWRAAMDTGGGRTDEDVWTRTEEIYEWLRLHKWRGIVFGTKGASRAMPNGPRVKISVIDKFPRSQIPIAGGLELRILDTALYKALLHWRLTRTGDESQRFYLDADTDMDYAKQFLSERLVTHKNKRPEWISHGANHLLDCEVGASAAADSQWLPSLKMLAGYLKALQAQQETAAREAQSHSTDTRSQPPEARSRW